MVRSDLRVEVEIWSFCACDMHLAIIIGTVWSLWTFGFGADTAFTERVSTFRHKAVAYGSRNRKLLGTNAGGLESDAVHILMFSTSVSNTVITSTRFGDRAFAAAGPRLWNSLPADVRRTDVTVETFCRKLKTYLFGRDASTCDCCF